MATLTKVQHARLKALEDVITTSARWQREEAKALATIRRERLYRSRYASFDDYVQQRLGFERSHAHRLAAWGDVLDTLSPIGGAQPERETHVRPLIGLPDEQQRDIWRIVQTRLGGRRTAAEIAAIAEDYLRPEKRQASAQTAARPEATVVMGDAVQQVKTLADGSVDLCFFSPPYPGVKRDFPSVTEAEFPEWMATLMTAIRPKLSPRGSCVINFRESVKNGGISDVGLRMRLAIRAAGWREIDVLIWGKPDAVPLGRTDRPRRAYEYLHWFALDGNPFVDLFACGRELDDDARQPRTRHTKHHKTYNHSDHVHRIRGDRARVTDVIVAPIGGNARDVDHDAMFPQNLADQIVRTFSPQDGLVIDPCCGSGTTLIAARAAGRRSWGCDVVPRFAKLARQRLSET